MTHDYNQVFHTDRPEWQDVLNIFYQNEQFPKKRVRGRAYHHKFPRAFSRMLNEPIDNSPDNIVSLSFAQHLIIHYYYYILAKKPYKYRMALAFKYMIDTSKQHITDISQEIINDMATKYQDAVMLANEYASITYKNRPITAETRKRISKALKGHPVSEETRKKNRDAHRGLKWTDEQKAKLSAIRKGHPDYLTEEGRARLKMKLRLNKLGTTATEETKKKMSLSQKGHIGAFRGKHLSEEHRKNISDSMKKAHIVRSKETREKMSASRLGAHYITINGKRKRIPPNSIQQPTEST